MCEKRLSVTASEEDCLNLLYKKIMYADNLVCGFEKADQSTRFMVRTNIHLEFYGI